MVCMKEGAPGSGGCGWQNFKNGISGSHNYRNTQNWRPPVLFFSRGILEVWTRTSSVIHGETVGGGPSSLLLRTEPYLPNVFSLDVYNIQHPIPGF